MNRAERRRRTEVIIARRREEIRWSEMLNWVNSRYIGRCRNMSPFDCGRPRCGVCGWMKRRIAGATRQEVAVELKHREELSEWQGQS